MSGTNEMDEGIYDEGMYDEGAYDEAMYDEASRRPRRVNPGPTARGSGYYQPRPPQNAVSQTQLQVTVQKIAGDVQKNSMAIQRLAKQVNDVTSRLAQQDTRKGRDISKVKADLKGQLDTMILVTLLQKQPTLVDGTTNQPPTATTDVQNLRLLPADNTLPVVALAAAGSGDSGGGPFGSGSNTLLLFLALSGSL